MRARKLMPFILVGVFLALAAVGLIAGWLAGGKGVNSADTPASASPAHPDPNGKRACDMLADAEQYGAWGDHVLVGNVANAARASTNSFIAAHGAQLAGRLAIAS